MPNEMLYIMRAYHLYEDEPNLKLGHLIRELIGEGGSIIFAARAKTAFGGAVADYLPTQILNHNFILPDQYVIDAPMKYTIDTGLGHTHRGYKIVIKGYINVDAHGKLVNWRGQLPWIDAEPGSMPEHLNLHAKVSAWVFK